MSRPLLILHLVMSKLAPPHFRNELLGDMEEEFNRIASQDSLGAASRWYAVQILHSVPPFIGRLARIYRLGHAGAGAVAGYWAIFFCEIIMLSLVTGTEKSMASYEFISSNFLQVIFVEMFSLAVGGLFVGLLASGNSGNSRVGRIVACAFLSGVFIVPCMVNMFLYPDLVPFAMRVTFSILVFPSICIGSIVGKLLHNRTLRL